MSFLIEKTHEQRLNEEELTILTEYQDGKDLKRRCSDHSVEDEVNAGVILDKRYYRHGRLLHQETEFNPGIRYSFVFPKLQDGRIQCPNCGATGEPAGFQSGCPYCGSYYNLEYARKDLGSRRHTDYVVAEKPVRFTTVLLCFGPVLLVSLLVFYLFSRTHTVFDLVKALGLGLLAGLVILLISASHRAGVAVTAEGVQKKARQDQLLASFERDLKELGLSMSDFVNAVNIQLREYYFGPDSEPRGDVIDFDVLDYREQRVTERKQTDARIELLLQMRLVTVAGEKLESRDVVQRAVLRRQAKKGIDIAPGANFLTCPHCGASLDLSAKSCPNCGTSILWRCPLVLESLTPEA